MDGQASVRVYHSTFPGRYATVQVTDDGKTVLARDLIWADDQTHEVCIPAEDVERLAGKRVRLDDPEGLILKYDRVSIMFDKRAPFKRVGEVLIQK